MNDNKAKKLFFKYVTQNVLGMICISVYILADTFFISVAQGESGVAALNLVLPVYSFIFAVGSMIGIGSAIRFKIFRARENKEGEYYLSNAIFFAVMLGSIFLLVGLFMPEKVLALFGADEELIAAGKDYTRIFMMFSPFFMMNYIFNAFIRNDNATALAMSATIASSFFNIIMDYILMFPLKMGMSGAALATGLAPCIGVIICSTHFLSKKNTLKFMWVFPSFKRFFSACKLGAAAFVGEISSGITTMIFNFLILGLSGNVGVAAYAVVANVAMVATSVFNGVSQGSQPIISNYYGKKDKKALSQILKMSVITAFCFSVVIITAINLFAVQTANIFNSENNYLLMEYAVTGIRIYFIGYLFTGFNIVGMGYLSATAKEGWTFVTSFLRGFIVITVCAFLLSALFKMNGIWAAFPVSEFIIAVIICTAIISSCNEKTNVKSI